MSSTLMVNKKGKSVRGSLQRSSGAKVLLTANDLKLFALLLDFRLMNATQIMLWLDCNTAGKKRALQQRLKKLFDKPNMFVDRVSSGTYFVEGGGSEPMIYALNNKGRKALIESDPKKYAGVSQRVGNKALKSNFVHHTILNTEIATHIKQGCDQTEAWLYATRSRFFDEICTDSLKTHPNRHPNNYYGWPVSFHVEKQDRFGEPVVVQELKTLAPDYFSCIVNKHTGKQLYLFTEADYSNEPIERISSKLKQSDIWGKMMLYDRSAKEQLLKKYFDLNSPFRILFVTLSEQRVENMIMANKEKSIRQGRGWHKFLFTTRDALNEHGFLDVPWRNGEDDTTLYFRDYEL